jgi:hypothetical protein
MNEVGDREDERLGSMMTPLPDTRGTCDVGLMAAKRKVVGQSWHIKHTTSTPEILNQKYSPLSHTISAISTTLIQFLSPRHSLHCTKHSLY